MMHEPLRALIFSTAASSAAILLVLLLRRPVRHRAGARVAYALWLSVPLTALAALLPAPLQSSSLRIASAPLTDIVVAAAAALPAVGDIVGAPWLAAAWLLGCALAGALFVLQQRRFVARLGRLSAAGEGIAIAQTNAGCPALIGAWRPRIVLPADFEQRYSAAERELILAHERTHRRRGDVQANGLAALLRSAFWFNPLVHFAASRFRFDQELACDANVIARFPEARRTYADAMLKTQLAGAGLPVGCYWQSSQPHPLTERIAMLKQSSPGRTRIAFGTGLAALLALAGSYAAWAVQPATVGDAAPDVYQNARALDTAPASYPQAAIGARQQGKLVLKVQIDEHGDVRSAEVASADPPEAKAAFAESSIAAALHWKFDPASKNGKPVTSYAMVPIAFTLDDED